MSLKYSQLAISSSEGFITVLLVYSSPMSSMAPVLGEEYQMASQFFWAMSGRQRKLMNFSAFSLFLASLGMTMQSTQTLLPSLGMA